MVLLGQHVLLPALSVPAPVPVYAPAPYVPLPLLPAVYAVTTVLSYVLATSAGPISAPSSDQGRGRGRQGHIMRERGRGQGGALYLYLNPQHRCITRGAYHPRVREQRSSLVPSISHTPTQGSINGTCVLHAGSMCLSWRRC